MFDRLRRGSRSQTKAAAVEEPSVWSMVWSVVRPERLRIIGLASVSLLGGLLEALFLIVITTLALNVADGSDTIEVASTSFGTASAIIVAAVSLTLRLVAGIAAVLWTNALLAKTSISLRDRLASAYLDASWATQDGEPSGHLQQLVTTFTTQALGVVNSFANVIIALLSLTALLVGAVVVDPGATVLITLTLLALGSLLAPVRRRVRVRSRAAASTQLDFANAVAELGSLGLEMQTFGVRPEFARRIDDLVRREVETKRRADVLRGLLTPMYTTLAYGAVLLAVAAATAVDASRIPALGAVMLVLLRSLSYGQTVQAGYGNLHAAAPYLERVEDTIDRYLARPALGGVRVADMSATLRFKDVSFQYVDERPVLSNVTLDIEAGSIIGVIGPSGAGKSSLVQLLLGVRSPTGGSITVGGVELDDIDRRSWHDRVSFVPQEPRMFTGTVADNVRFFRSSISDDAVVGAASEANIAEEIEALPHGFATHLGERGSALSGGQRQRLSIARALAGRPELIVLDEPTSSLDSRSEVLICDSIARQRGIVTVVLIAHKMSTIAMCDRIAVIEDGTVTAFGTPAELAASSSYYRRAVLSSGERATEEEQA